jgi:enoyl-CoA hydratase/carnithine racemase
MGEWQYIRMEVDDRIATLVIDHPPVNSFNTTVIDELGQAVDELLGDDAVKAVVITGAGTNAFVAGADISEIKTLLGQPGGLKMASEAGHALFAKVEQAVKPVIAAIDGFCLGGGLELAMACHLRICSDRSRLGQPEINLGIIPGWGGTQRLPRLVGRGKAIEMILTGDMIRAQEAYSIGLVNKVVPSGAVLKEAHSLARKLASKSRPAVAAALCAIDAGLQVPLDAGLEGEAEAFASLQDTEDALEGVSAFLEKRQAQFKDR